MGNASGRTVGEIPLKRSESNQALICGLDSRLQSAPSCLRRCVKMRRIHSFAGSEKCTGFSFWSSRRRTESTLGTGRKQGPLTKCELCSENEDCRNKQKIHNPFIFSGSVILVSCSLFCPNLYYYTIAETNYRNKLIHLLGPRFIKYASKQ